MKQKDARPFGVAARLFLRVQTGVVGDPQDSRENTKKHTLLWKYEIIIMKPTRKPIEKQDVVQRPRESGSGSAGRLAPAWLYSWPKSAQLIERLKNTFIGGENT